MKKICTILLSLIVCDSCWLLDMVDSEPGFALRNNTNERLICILDYRPSIDSISDMNKQWFVRPNDINYYFGPYADQWESLIRDSVYIYLAFHDSLFVEEERFPNIIASEIKQDALIVRYRFLKEEIYFPQSSKALWFDFPPLQDSNVPVKWYNSHSVEDFASGDNQLQ